MLTVANIDINPQWILDNIAIVFITGVVGLLLGLITKKLTKLTTDIHSFIESSEKQNAAIKNIIKTIITLMHDEAVKEGYINKYKLNCVEVLYNTYRSFNGNSFVEDLIKELRELPGKKEG